jgi:GntR family transcriptional regulator/MocR family aminotransferase
MRRIYAARREALLAVLARHCGDRLAPIPAAAGLHLAARLSAPLRAGAVAARAAQADVAIEPLGRYSAVRPVNGLAFGLGMIATDRIDEAIRRLARAMS